MLEGVRCWLDWPLDGIYPVVFFDALRVKTGDGYLASKSEGAQFWLKVGNELRTRAVGDILIAVVDGLSDFPDAIAAVFPRAAVQTCVVRLICNSLAFVAWKDRKTVMPDLRAI